jgi:TP901 family phage tail tape measure protein
MATADAGSIRVRIVGDASGLIEAVDTSKKKVESLGSFTQKHSKAMMLAGGAIMGALGVSAKAAMDFQEQMANVSTMLDKTSMKYMPEFSKGIQDMATQFGEGTDTLATGLYNILSASVPPAKALDVLKVSVQSAKAGLTDTGVAADAITTILNSYGLSADKAGEVSDKLFAIVKRGKTTFGQLAPSIGRVAATAATAGVSLDDLGAMIATLTRAGVSTDEAMTSINGVIAAFLKPTADAQKAAAEFGLTLDSNTLKTIGLKGVMDKLNGATAEQLATIFPNIRALKGMAAALQNAKGFAKDYKTMVQATGSTQEALGKQTDIAKFKMAQLKEEFIIASQNIGKTLLPTITDLIKGANGLISKFNNLPEPVQKIITNFALFTGGGLLAAGAVGKISKGVQDFMPILSGMFGFIKNTAIPGLISFQVAIGPIGWAIEGIIAVIALLVVAWKKDWGGIREKTAAVWEKIKPIFEGIKKVFKIL